MCAGVHVETVNFNLKMLTFPCWVRLDVLISLQIFQSREIERVYFITITVRKRCNYRVLER